MNHYPRQYVEQLEREICELKERLAGAPQGSPSQVPAAEDTEVEILAFDLEPTTDPDIFVWRCALPIGGVSLVLSRKELKQVCANIVKRQLHILRAVDRDSIR